MLKLSISASVMIHALNAYDNYSKSFPEAFKINKDTLKFENKYLKSHTNNEEFTIEVKEEFLIDMIDGVFSISEKLMPILPVAVPIIQSINQDMKAFKAKWDTSETNPFNMIHNKKPVVFSSEGWDFVIDSVNSTDSLILKDGETTVQVDNFLILNPKTKAGFKVYSHQLQLIVENKLYLIVKYPKSLQVALKNLLTDYYKITL